MATILDKKFFEKFFKLYSKCSNLYANILNLNAYLIISYYKAKDNYIYSYEYIDFDLLFCHKTGSYNNSKNYSLSNEYEIKKNEFLAANYKNNFFNELLVLDKIGKMILNKKQDFISIISKTDVMLLNDIYKKVLVIE